MNRSRLTHLRIFSAVLVLATTARAALPDVGSAATEAQFRELYKELVETNTTLSAGSCTLAAERMAARLKSAGFADSDLHPFADPAHPQEGGLVAVYPGRDKKLKSVLLLAHIDVVEARREDWTRDPFKLVEENGSFYARGAFDDKAEAAIWVDTLIRYRHENFKPRRTLKLALTCGEETAGAFNGAQWLTQNRKELIDSEFAVNEGAMGELDAHGNRTVLQVQAGEKYPQNYRLEVINRAGATDGEFLNAAGIPTYGIEPVFVGSDLGNIHGLNEYVGVKSLLEGRDFLYRLIKIYADAP